MTSADLLTARELVAALRRYRVGAWTTDAVRQWIRQSPPCPIAARAERDGSSHLFELRAVLVWLAERGERERRGAGWHTRAVSVAARKAIAEIESAGVRRLISRARRCVQWLRFGALD